MNILFICDEYPQGRYGGIGTAVQLLGRTLVEQGHKIYVAGLYSYRYGQPDYEEDKGVKVWRLRYGLNLKVEGTSRLYNLLEKFPAGIRKNLNGKKAFDIYIHFIKDLIETEKIDIIEIPDWNTFAMFMGFVVKWPALKIPLLVKSHGSYTYFNTELNKSLKPLLHQIDLELYKRADAFSAVSQYTSVENKKLFPIKKPVKILYNAIHIPEQVIEERRDAQTVIFTGTLAEKKGIFQLMKAWNIVNKKFPDAKLQVFGKGKIKPLKELLNSDAIKTVYFNGHVEREKLFGALSKATLAVFPSFSETFGLMSVEAMSVGCPVIYTKRSCGTEIIQDHENGILVDPSDVNEIASAIILLIEDKTLRDKFSRNGKTTVETKFNIENSAREHISYYTGVINEFKMAVKN